MRPLSPEDQAREDLAFDLAVFGHAFPDVDGPDDLDGDDEETLEERYADALIADGIDDGDMEDR